MALSKITSVELNSRGATTLDNKPTISAQKLKEEFDAPAKEVVAPAVNRLVDELEADTAALNLGVNVPNGLPESTQKNIQSVLNALTTEVRKKEDTPENIDVLDAISDVGGDLYYNENKMAKSSDLPTKTSDLVNDSNYVEDADYVHTDNNYSDAEKALVASAVQDADYNHTDNNYTDADKALVYSAVHDTNYVHTDNNFSDAEKSNNESNTQARHTHGNKTVLDKFGESGGKPLYDGQPIGGGGGGSSVEWQQNVTEGTEIAEITIDGETTKVYAPTGGGGTSTDYSTLSSKPQINGETLLGNKTAAQLGLVPSTRSVNGKALSSDVTLGASDVGALPDNTQIPTEQTVASWGFTKNTGTYVKPDNGIPESDLDSSLKQKIAKLDSNGQIDYSDVKNKTAIENPTAKEDGQVLTYRNGEWGAEDSQGGSGSGSVLVWDWLEAGNDEITITPPSGKEDLFKNDNALYVPIFEPTEQNPDGTYKVLTCVHEIVDTTNGRITVRTAEKPSVNTKVGIQVTAF